MNSLRDRKYIYGPPKPNTDTNETYYLTLDNPVYIISTNEEKKKMREGILRFSFDKNRARFITSRIYSRA